MSKYGFNENELVKTVMDMVDKDGFHKQVVIQGKVAPSIPEMKAGLLSTEEDALTSSVTINFVAVNVPEGTTVYFDTFTSSEDFVYDIGDTMDTTNSGTEDSKINGINGAVVHSVLSDETTTAYFHVYALDEDDKVVERTKLEVSLET